MSLNTMKCWLHGHHYRFITSSTPIEILHSLIEDEFVFDIVLDQALEKRIAWMADYYRREYGNAIISDLICIKCGRKDPCIENMKSKMREELKSFLFRPDKNLETNYE